MLIRFFAPALLLLLPAAAQADTRRDMVTSFDRIRVQGPYEVRLVTGSGASARIEADHRAIDRVSIDVQGTTLTVSTGSYDRHEPLAADAALPVVTLTTPSLRGALVNGGGRLTITGMKAQRIDLYVGGSGGLAASGVTTDELTATVLGSGSIALAGTAGRANLLVSGQGAIDAGALAAHDLTARLDGPGDIKGNASATARATATGTGGITVLGTATCTVDRTAGGPVVCGK